MRDIATSVPSPSRDDLQIQPLTRVDDKELMKVYDAENDFSSTTRRKDNKNLFNAHGDNC